MNCTILNREFKHPSDEWYQFEPSGEHVNELAGVMQVLDQEALVSIANRFNKLAEAPDFPGLMIDRDHLRHQMSQETRAYGWLMKVQNRADGLYGQIKWTATGKAAVDGMDYRYFSTEYSPKDLQVLNSKKRVRPLALSGLTLTNDPNNRGARPITNRASGAEDNTRKPMTTVATKLGLAPEASESAILDAVNILNRRATDAETAKTTAEAESAKLKVEIAGYATSRIDTELSRLDAEPIKNRVNAEQREAWKALLTASYEHGRKALTGFIESIKPDVTKAAVTNRATTKTPDTNTEKKAEPNHIILNRKVREYQASHPGTTYAKADEIVSRDNPDLLVEQAAA